MYRGCAAKNLNGPEGCLLETNISITTYPHTMCVCRRYLMGLMPRPRANYVINSLLNLKSTYPRDYPLSDYPDGRDDITFKITLRLPCISN